MYSLAEMEWPSGLVLLVLAAMVSILLIRSRRYFARQAMRQIPKMPAEHPKPSRRAHHLGAPEEMLQWDVEMHEVARDLSGQLDSKMMALGHLIREADRAAARLEAALLAAASAGRENRTTEKPDEPETRSVPESRHQAEALGGTAASAGEAMPAAARVSSSAERYEEIYALADYGYPVLEIAQRLGLPAGEVELILNLRERK